MGLGSLKDKISSIAGNETLGLAEVEVTEPVKEVIKKEPKPKKQSKKTVKREINESYGEILDLLGINKEIRIRDKFTADDVAGIQFTPTTPVGLDVDEVGEFVLLMGNLLYQYEDAIAQRDKDIAILASEVKRIEERFAEYTQKAQMDMMMSGPTEEDKLNEQIMELVIQRDTMQGTINDLQRKLRVASSSNSTNIEMEARIRQLEEENEFLRLRNANLSSQETEEVIVEPELPETEPIKPKEDVFVKKSLSELMRDAEGVEGDSLEPIPELQGEENKILADELSGDDIFDSLLNDLK